MSQDSTLHAGSRAKVMRIIWLLASALVLFTVESIWIAPWLKNKLPVIPNLAPEALSGLWFLALLAAVSIAHWAWRAKTINAPSRPEATRS